MGGWLGRWVSENVYAVASFYLNHLYVLPRLFEHGLCVGVGGWVGWMEGKKAV